jgi:hypothetical protein
MTRPRDVSSAFWLVWTAVLATAPAPARAATPDFRAAQNRLEDQLIEGEIDAEDFLAWHLAPGSSVGPPRRAVYLGLEAFVVEKASGASELGALLVLELPLERFVRARTPAAPLAYETRIVEGPGAAWLGAHAAEGLVSETERASVVGIAQTAVPKVERTALAPTLSITIEVARSCVRAALRTVGLADDNRLDSVGARARSSAALPELRLRAVRTLGESGRISLSEDDPSRYVASGAATNVLEARLTFRLDRLLFADEEITVERARLDRSELRSRIAAKVLQALFEWQKAYALMQDPALSSEDRFSAVLREAESSAILDMMTGGWFGAYHAALAARAP